MVLENDGGKSGWWGIHSSKSRMIIYSPEEGFYIYLVRQVTQDRTRTSADSRVECIACISIGWRDDAYIARYT